MGSSAIQILQLAAGLKHVFSKALIAPNSSVDCSFKLCLRLTLLSLQDSGNDLQLFLVVNAFLVFLAASLKHFVLDPWEEADYFGAAGYPTIWQDVYEVRKSAPS